MSLLLFFTNLDASAGIIERAKDLFASLADIPVEFRVDITDASLGNPQI